MTMNREEKIKIYTEGLERGLQVAIERAEMMVVTFEQPLYDAYTLPGHVDGAQKVVDGLKKLKEALLNG